MNSGVRIHTDRVTFDQWATAMAGVDIPVDMQSKDIVLEPEESHFSPGEDVDPANRGGSSSPLGSGAPVPPLVAASMALHGYAEVVVTLRLALPTSAVTACFGLVGGLAASLVHRGVEVEIGLFDLDELVGEVMRLIPVDPPSIGESSSVRIAVLGANAAIAGWQETLIGGQDHWLRLQSNDDPLRWTPMLDVYQELALDLRFALADCLAGDDDA